MSQVYGDFELKDRVYLHDCVVDPAPLHFNGEINPRKETVSFTHLFDSHSVLWQWDVSISLWMGGWEITELPWEEHFVLCACEQKLNKSNTICFCVNLLIANLSEADPGFYRGCANPNRGAGGRPPIIRPTFRENCIKMKKREMVRPKF